jgi:hypothetical protein
VSARARGGPLVRGIALLALGAAGAIAQGNPPNVVGRVVSIEGTAVSDIEVRVEGTQLTARTDRAGRFAFSDVPQGVHEIVARGIGYLPSRLAVRVPDETAAVTLTLLPAPRALDTVSVRARVRVLSGIVVDEENHPVPGAIIELATGDRASFTTDEGGWFTFTSVRAGSVVFRVRKEGFYSATQAVRLDDWRGLVVHLEALPPGLSESRKLDESGFGNSAIAAWKDATLRLAMRGSRAVVVPEEELRPYTGMTLGEAIRLTRSGASLAIDLQWVGSNICVLLDGRRAVGNTTLDSWRAGEVEMVELYPPGTEPSRTVARYLSMAGCRTVIPPAGRVRGPFYAVIWTK